MIPKRIHYCWLSDEPFPRKIRKCMDTWRKTHPDYEIVRWSTENFDVESIPYVKEAFEAKKWAFAADYIRMYALYTEGGIYLDSDVVLLKRFDDFLDNSFFSSMEYHTAQIEKCGTMQYIDAEGRRTADKYIEGIQIRVFNRSPALNDIAGRKAFKILPRVFCRRNIALFAATEQKGGQ